MGRSLIHALRALRKAPTFTLATTLLVGLGVGVVTTVYTVVDHVVLRPLPYPAAERLVYMTNGSHNGATLRRLENDETMLVQSGKPVGVFRTHEEAPRVLIANANLVPRWGTWDVFRDLEQKGLTMYGQMTAGSWIYIGSQGIVQGTYETFAALADRHFNGSLAGRIALSGGLGGMGGAQPLAITMNGGVAVVVEVDGKTRNPQQ